MSFVGRSPLAEDPALPALRARVAAALFDRIEVGEHIGRYESLSLLATTAVGDLHLARDPRGERPVLVTVVQGLSSQGRGRVLEIADTIAGIDHPGVVPVLAAGERGTAVYVVTPTSPSQSLAAWEVGRERAELLGAYRQVASALAAVHDAGAIHGAFSANDAIVDGDGRVRVTNFGLAVDRLERGARLDSQGSSNPRWPALPPELFAGGSASELGDQFAVSSSLLAALRSGGGSLEQARSRAEALARLEPAWLRRTLARGLDVHPSRRWPDMHFLQAALDPGRSWWHRL